MGYDGQDMAYYGGMVCSSTVLANLFVLDERAETIMYDPISGCGWPWP